MTQKDQTSDEEDTDGSTEVGSQELTHNPVELSSFVYQYFDSGKSWCDILRLLSGRWSPGEIKIMMRRVGVKEPILEISDELPEP